MTTMLKTILVTTLIAISSSAAMAAQSSGRGGGGGGGGGSDPAQALSYGCLTTGYGCKDKPVYTQSECSTTRVLERVGYNAYRWVYRCEVPRHDIF